MNRRSYLRPRALAVVAATAALALTAAVGAPSGAAGAPHRAAGPGVGLSSSFDFDAEGWTAIEANDPTFWSGSGGNPGGNVAAQRGTGAATGLASPTTWAGDRSGLLGGTLSFDVKLSAGTTTSGIEVFLNSDNSEVPYVYQVIPVGGTLPAWTSYSLKVKPKQGWQVDSSTGARRSDFKAVLSSLTSVTIAGSTTNASDTLYLDNVVAASDVDVSLSLAYKADRFFGRLTPAGGCASDRKLALYRVRPGPDTRYGTVKTNGRGQWAIDDRNPPAGSYYAKIKGGYVEGGGNCSAARSSLVKVG